MKNYVILLLFAICAVVSACTKAEEPSTVKQSELNKEIVGVDESIDKYYYSGWSQDETYPWMLGGVSCVLEYDIKDCSKVAVMSFNRYPFDICKDGTTIIVNDVSRYTDDTQSGEKYIPLCLSEVEISYDGKKELYSGESLTNQSAISWKHLDSSLYELKFASNSLTNIQNIRIGVDFSDPENPDPFGDPHSGFSMYFRQLNK